MAPARLRQLLQWCVCLLLVYGCVELLTVGLFSAPAPPGSCELDNEGQWSIGIFKGDSLQTLKPVEQWQPRADTDAAWPIANPVLTCAHVDDAKSSFVADPFLYRKDKSNWYLFYETKTLHNMQGDIGAAVSHDGGLTWKHVGVVLNEEHHLSYPFVFEHDGKMYLMPEISTSGELRLYTTDTFPTGWRLDKVLIKQPLIDASLVAPMEGVANSDGKWYIFASNRNQPTSKNCRELEVWMADDLHGPWRLHPQHPVRAGLQGSRMAGRPVVADGELYRFAQDCSYTYGHRVRKFHVTSLNSTHFSEVEEHLGFDPAAGREGDTTWNSQRYHHIDAQQLPSGEWVAVMDGDRYVSDYLTWEWLRRQVYVVPVSVACTLLLGVCLLLGGPLPALRACGAWGLCRSCWLHMGRHVEAVVPGPMYTRISAVLDAHGSPAAFDVECAKRGMPNKAAPLTSSKASLSAMGRRSWAAQKLVDADAAFRRPLPLCGVLNGYQALALLLGLWLCTWLGMWLAWTVGRTQLLRLIVWYLQAAGGSRQPWAMDHQVSKFTMVVMSYEARLLTLQTFVRHYSQCSSVAEIVVVWNKGKPPRPLFDLPASQVPVRVRAEPENSMNNRFKPDPLIHTRGVLILDDDILMPCADIERGFARWRAHPDRVTGFYPRLLEGDPPQYKCKHCEAHTYAQGMFNIILAGAAFVDQEVVFPLYSGHSNKKGREYVDKVFNCDDLLLNYLMAKHVGASEQHAEWVRPSKRFDVGRLTSKRLSTGNFGPVRHNCTRDFAEMFGNPLVNRAYHLQFDHMAKPSCPRALGCIFV